MKHPPYHLRPNKAVDRLTFLEAIRRLGKLSRLSAYTYYGFGGPHLEEFQLLYEFCPEIKMVSIEEEKETFKRQKFHRPCAKPHLQLVNNNFKSFLDQFQASDRKSIFWLDYTGLEYKYFEEFQDLLGKVAEGSVIKITLQCQPRRYSEDKDKDDFRKKFADVMPNPAAAPPAFLEEFSCFLQEMLQVATQQALPGAVRLMFQPISSFYYTDGTGMFTLTGVVCSRTEVDKIKKAFQDWELANLDWAKPRKIDVPVLSTKERLHLQKRLPCKRNSGKTLHKTLGYLINRDIAKTEDQLKNYADFHRYSPYFMKAIP